MGRADEIWREKPVREGKLVAMVQGTSQSKTRMESTWNFDGDAESLSLSSSKENKQESTVNRHYECLLTACAFVWLLACAPIGMSEEEVEARHLSYMVVYPY